MACGEDEEPMTGGGNGTENATVWAGDNISFSKAAGANPADAASQDRLTSNVWLTRGNEGGQIYNAVTETASDKDTSPSGTLWAIGDIDDAATLDFQLFRAAVGEPQDVVGKDLVVFLQDDNILLSMNFTSWDMGRAGGFAYTRSTP